MLFPGFFLDGELPFQLEAHTRNCYLLFQFLNVTIQQILNAQKLTNTQLEDFRLCAFRLHVYTFKWDFRLVI